MRLRPHPSERESRAVNISALLCFLILGVKTNKLYRKLKPLDEAVPIEGVRRHHFAHVLAPNKIFIEDLRH